MTTGLFVIHLVSVVGVCLGIKTASMAGMMLNRISKWIKDKVGEFWHKPLFGCAGCMASVWGIPTYIYVSWLCGWITIAYLPIVIISSVFINAYLWKTYEKKIMDIEPDDLYDS
jgi:hypothetical protein